MSSTTRHIRRQSARARIRQTLADARAAEPVYVGPVGDDFEAFMVGRAMVVTYRTLPGMAPEMRAAVDRRREATLTGRCPCGGRSHMGPSGGGIVTADLRHEHDCPAADVNLLALATATGWTFEGAT